MKRFSNILFVSSSIEEDLAALRQAQKLACENQARLTVLRVVKASKKVSVGANRKGKKLIDSIIEQELEELESVIADCAFKGSPPELNILVGIRFIEIIRSVLKHNYDLVIKGAESAAHFYGGTDLKLIRKCPCPVWIIKPTQPHEFRTIVAAVDYDPEEPSVDSLNAQVLEMATSLALSNFSQLHVVHVWHLQHEDFLRSARSGSTSNEIDTMVNEEFEERQLWLNEMVSKYCSPNSQNSRDYLQPKIHLRKGSASQLVPSIIQELGAELVVMGTVGRIGIPGFLVGNTAEDILNQIRCSVLTVKPQGFVSPVT